MKSKKQVVVEFLNNDNTKTEWTIAVLEEGTIIVFENGSQTENTKSSLRYIAEYIGFSYDKNWTTRQFGSKLIDHIHSLQDVKCVRVRIEVDIAEHDYVVFNCDEDMSESYAFNGDDGPNEIRIYLNGEKIDYDDDVIDEVMGNATESPYQTFDLGKKWEDFEYITKFGYWDNISTIVWEFDVEDFDINKLTFHYECFDAIFELADYNAEEHCINLLYDGKKIEVSDAGSSDGDFEECWNLDDDDDCWEDENENSDDDNNESPQERRTISQNDFKDCKDLTEITIPDYVTEIGEGAFNRCTGLTEINIPDSVTEIGEGAFEGCTGLTKINIPDSVTVIGENAFYDCTGLTKINIPDSVTKIGESAFDGCTGLTEINIPSSIKEIEDYAFQGCISLETITLGTGVNKISEDAFDSYDALKAIYVPAKETDYYKKRLPEKLHSLIVELAPVKKAKSKNK